MDFDIPFVDFLAGINLPSHENEMPYLTPQQRAKVLEIAKEFDNKREKKDQTTSMTENKSKPILRKTTRFDKIIGKNLRAIRLAKGYTPQKLAVALDLTTPQIYHYEGGRNRITAAKLCRISQILNVPVLDFLKGIDLPDNTIKVTNLTKEKSADIIKIINESDEKDGENEDESHDGNIMIFVLKNE